MPAYCTRIYKSLFFFSARGTELWDDSDERSPLLTALHAESIPIIKLLLENGAEITDSIREYVDECDFDDEMSDNEEIRKLLGM